MQPLTSWHALIDSCWLCSNIQRVSNLRWFDLGFFDFMMVKKPYALGRNHTLNLEFGPFPGLVICSRMLSCDAGQGSEPQLPVSHTITRVNN